MKIGSYKILCGNCKVPQDVEVHSIETTEDSVKIAYTCTHCEKTQFEEFIPKNKQQ